MQSAQSVLFATLILQDPELLYMSHTLNNIAHMVSTVLTQCGVLKLVCHIPKKKDL